MIDFDQIPNLDTIPRPSEPRREDGFEDPEPDLVEKARAGIEAIKRRNRGAPPGLAPTTRGIPISQRDED